MPAVGDGRISSLIVAAMSGTQDYSSEFMYDEDRSPLPTLDAFDDAADACQGYDATPAGDLEEPLSPLAAFANTPISLHYANDGSPDTLSDSSSSKRTGSSISTKTTLTGGDVRMGDGLDGKLDLNYDEYIHADDALGFFMTDRNNPSSSAGKVVGMHSALASPISTPSPFEEPKEEPSPQAASLPSGVKTGAATSPVRNDATPSYGNGHSYSVSQSINGFTTAGSRDVSPFTNLIGSQDSSPMALLNSPSATAPFDFGRLPGVLDSALHNPWASFPLNFAAHEHGAGGIMPGLMSSAVSTQFQFQGFYGTGPYTLRIASTPSKSRVETQIPIRMMLSPLPVGVKKLHLPTHTISKPKLLAKPTPAPSPDMLELHTVLVCTSAMQNPELKERALQRARASAMAGRESSRFSTPMEEEVSEEDKPQNGGEVHICSGCITRERKRAGRKKVKKPEDEEMWRQDESRRVIVFNTAEVKDWQQPAPEAELLAGPTGFQIDAPMRIACYCRHHAEKLGFQIILTITNHLGQFIAQSMSPSIMITDDHKTPVLPQVMGGVATMTDDVSTVPSSTSGAMSNNARDENSLSPSGAPFQLSPSTSDLQPAKRNVPYTFPPAPAALSPGQTQAGAPIRAIAPRHLSRSASPTGPSGPCSKKRKSSGSITRVPSALAMTRLETTQLPIHQVSGQSAGGATSRAASPFLPAQTSFALPADSPMFPAGSLAQAQSLAPNPKTPNGNDSGLFASVNRSASMDDKHMAMAQMYSAPASTHPSRAPSPSSSAQINGNNNLSQANPFAQTLATSISPFHGLPLTIHPLAPVSVIHKIIPAEGPKSGGIEVTILGGGFYQGLEVMFGDVKATTTTFWGETSLVCLLPPSPVSGPVPVTFKQQIGQSPPSFHKPPPTFKYVDDDEQQLMRTAFAVLASKMTGSFEDTRELARRIIGDSGGASWGASGSAGNQHSGGAGFNNFAFNLDFETQLIKVLELVDLDDSAHKPRFNLKRSTGQTMLHLACAMGLNRFVAGLLARGASPDLRDRGGYTALHMAALNDHPQIVRRLVCCGADPTIRTLSGLTAADVARSDEVLRAVRRIERHARSRSGGSLHSRASSATSLRSLWEPLSPTRATEGDMPSAETDSSGESPEYSSSDLASENEESPDDVGDGRQRLNMRRRTMSRPPRTPRSSRSVSRPAPGDVTNAGLGSPSTTVAAFRDQLSAQLQQWQQTMSLHLQNLPQFPYLPQMPNMPVEYQAAMQRLASMMPQLGGGGSRPGSAGEEGLASTPKELMGRRWDLSSLIPSPAPPPAYEEIFPPQSAFDKKQASAAQAVVEAEADRKCALLFDQQPRSSTVVAVAASSSSSAPPAQAEQKLPVLLQIGRKNAITKEQQENLRRAHAERLKKLSRDRNLFFFWIPLLIIVVSAMLYNRFPYVFLAAWHFVLSFVRNEPAPPPLSVCTDRVVDVL